MTQTKPSIVFCHEIWADGSCFNKVIPTLQADGHQVIAAQYGLDTLAGDVATVKPRWAGSSARPFLSGTLTAEASSRLRELMTGSPGWSTSPHSPRTRTRPRRASRRNSPSPTFSLTLKLRTGVSGCSRTV